MKSFVAIFYLSASYLYKYKFIPKMHTKCHFHIICCFHVFFSIHVDVLVCIQNVRQCSAGLFIFHPGRIFCKDYKHEKSTLNKQPI